jgi:archaemetzincin
MRKKPFGALPAAALTLLRSSEKPRRRFYVPPAMRATRRAPGPVALQPLGPVPATELKFLEEVVAALLGARSIVLPALEMPPACWDASRRQFDADRLLDLLFARLPDAAMRVMGVLDSDMFAAGRTFVFGYAHLRDGVGVYSLARLREDWYGRAADEPKLRDRTWRAVAHELGHTFGNPHCEAAECVMRAVSHIESLDALSPSFCESCLKRVRRGVMVGPSSAEGRFQRAGALLRRRFPARAVAAYREATEKAPLEARYFNDLGVALLAVAERVEARRSFLKAAELAADFPHPYYNLGILAREEGGPAAAEQCFDEGLKRDADPVAAHRYLGKLYDELFGDPARARRHYQAYLELGGAEAEIVARAWALGARPGIPIEVDAEKP